jgi:hypothetical protein
VRRDTPIAKVIDPLMKLTCKSCEFDCVPIYVNLFLFSKRGPTCEWCMFVPICPHDWFHEILLNCPCILIIIVCLSLLDESTSHSTVFFSHNKSVNSTFSHNLSSLCLVLSAWNVKPSYDIDMSVRSILVHMVSHYHIAYDISSRLSCVE